ncbi:MAG: NAD(P)/FAD-dependent oxidoreductase [Acetobacteraceae bacterium]
MTTSSNEPFDVLVVGGGPAGSTVATLLARRGERVLLLEKEHHPRFHIGESLLPMNLPLFEELGVADEIAHIGIPKYGAELVSPWHDKPSTLDFAQGWDKRFPSAYEVRRSEFDHVLLKNAAAAGTQVIEGCRVTGVDFPAQGGVVARATGENGQEQQFEAKFLVDASGRDTLLATKFATKTSNRRHHSAAIYGHFTGARRLPGRAAGNISLFWFDHGWFWFIPLLDGTTSVGAVCHADFIKSRKTDVTTFFKSVIAMSPALSDRLRDAELTGPPTATGNYSYKSSRISGPGYIMVGDAYGFIDPVFSSGVLLAMKGGFLAADAVTACLHGPGAKAERVLRRYQADVDRAMVRFSWFIYRINRPGIRALFMRHGNPLRLREAVLSLLSGDVFRPSPIHMRLWLFKGMYYLKDIAAKWARTADRNANASAVKSGGA